MRLNHKVLDLLLLMGREIVPQTDDVQIQTDDVQIQTEEEEDERRHDSSAERSFVIMVPKVQIAGLIGRRGDSVNYIRRESRCRIVIKEEGGVSQDSSKREVVLHGTDYEIQVAKRLIHQRLAEIDAETGADIAPRFDRGPPPPRYNQYPRPYVFVVVVSLTNT